MYADYEYYLQEFCRGNEPKVNLAEWPKIAAAASREIDRLTFGRLQQGAEVTDDVKNAVCAVAEVLQKAEQAKSSIPIEVQSESVDGVSISYTDSGNLSKNCKESILDAANLWLPRSNALRYAGVY